MTAEQRQVDAALDRFAKAIDTPAREASIVLRGLDPVVLPAQPGRSARARARRTVLLAAAISLERGEPVPLPVDVAQPTVTAPDLTPVVQQVRTVLSAPVELRYRKTTLTVSPVRMSEFLVLPSERPDRRSRSVATRQMRTSRASRRGSTASLATRTSSSIGNGQVYDRPLRKRA